jgi:hypothetical protein
MKTPCPIHLLDSVAATCKSMNFENFQTSLSAILIFDKLPSTYEEKTFLFLLLQKSSSPVVKGTLSHGG